MTTDEHEHEREGEDPFAGLTLDEGWVSDAALCEPSAAVRARRAELDRLRADEEQGEARSRRRARWRRRRLRIIAIGTAIAFVAAVAIANDGGDSDLPPVQIENAAPSRVTGPHPTPKAAASRVPLGTPAHPDASGGSFTFLATQHRSKDPVAYDPCRPIEVHVNDRTAPKGADRILARAVRRIEVVSGLQIDLVTDGSAKAEAPRIDRPSVQPDRYGDRWAPVLVAWSDADEIPELAGDVDGLGGSSYVETADGTRVYVTGDVILDGPDLRSLLGEHDGPALIEDVILHELGHLLGLGHVGSKEEVMYPVGQPTPVGLGPGDRTGLTQLGQGACTARL